MGINKRRAELYDLDQLKDKVTEIGQFSGQLADMYSRMCRVLAQRQEAPDHINDLLEIQKLLNECQPYITTVLDKVLRCTELDEKFPWENSQK